MSAVLPTEMVARKSVKGGGVGVKDTKEFFF